MHTKMKGFSLIELVVVILIITILVAVAVPKMGRVVAVGRTQAAAKRVVADLHYARSVAMNQGKSVEVQFVVGGTSYTMPTAPDPNGGNVGYQVDLLNTPYSASLTEVDFSGRDTVLFDMYGLANASGEIVVQYGNTKIEILLNRFNGIAEIQ